MKKYLPTYDASYWEFLDAYVIMVRWGKLASSYQELDYIPGRVRLALAYASGTVAVVLRAVARYFG